MAIGQMAPREPTWTDSGVTKVTCFFPSSPSTVLKGTHLLLGNPKEFCEISHTSCFWTWDIRYQKETI